MKQKLERLMYMGLGAVIALIGYGFGTIRSSNVDAQPGPTVVEEIVCRRLKVVDAQGKTVAVLGKEVDMAGVARILGIHNTAGQEVFSVSIHPKGGGRVVLIGPDGAERKNGVSLNADETEAGVSIFGPEGKNISLNADETEAGVSIFGPEGKNLVSLNADETEARVTIFGPEGKNKVSLNADETEAGVSIFGPEAKNYVLLGIDEAKVSVEVGKEDGAASRLFTNKYGGGVAIFNNGGKNVGQFSVGDRGGGTITTRDKFGYRTGSVP